MIPIRYINKSRNYCPPNYNPSGVWFKQPAQFYSLNVSAETQAKYDAINLIHSSRLSFIADMLRSIFQDTVFADLRDNEFAGAFPSIHRPNTHQVMNVYGEVVQTIDDNGQEIHSLNARESIARNGLNDGNDDGNDTEYANQQFNQLNPPNVPVYIQPQERRLREGWTIEERQDPPLVPSFTLDESARLAGLDASHQAIQTFGSLTPEQRHEMAQLISYEAQHEMDTEILRSLAMIQEQQEAQQRALNHAQQLVNRIQAIERNLLANNPSPSTPTSPPPSIRQQFLNAINTYLVNT